MAEQTFEKQEHGCLLRRNVANSEPRGVGPERLVREFVTDAAIQAEHPS
jgi:hypothetical protein